MAASATEIANYRGNAAAALGSSSGAAASGVYGETSTDRINDRLDYITAANMQKNAGDYQRKIKERDELFEKIASKQLSINQMLPTDRDMVRKKYLKPMRDMLLKNPNLRSDPDQYVKFQELVKDFEEANSYGQHRFAMTSLLDADIAKETDPEKRQRMLSHREQTLAQGLFDEIKPYQNTLDFSNDIFVKGNPITTTSETISGDRIIKTSKTHTPLKDFVAGAISNYTDSPNKTLMNQMDVFRTSFNSLSDELKAQKIQLWNGKIQQANADEGLKEGDVGYVAPIQFNIVKDANGEEHVVVPETAARVVLAESILRGYQNATSETPEVSVLPSTIRKNNAAISRDLAEVKVAIPADAALKYAQAAKARADANKTNEETAALKQAPGNDKANGDYYINQMLSMVDPKHYESMGLPKAENDPQFKGTRVKGTILMGKDATGQVRSALAPEELRALGEVYNSQQGLAVRAPSAVIYNYDNKSDPYFITYYDQPNIKVKEKDPTTGKEKEVEKPQKPLVRVVRPNRVLERLVKGVVGENSTGKENDDYKLVSKRLKERSGKDNINATVFELLASPDYQVGTAPAAPAAPKPETKQKPTVPLKNVAPALKSKVDSLVNLYAK